ncbi:helix-turn-helix transcriptional regulator [Gracilibacillus timonensis]|uniref:helix-turn-helix transcriptional regulator n=1 Tax=Gracilibacillus timonensis TaxID=1816696 RepID=UPI00098EE589|nr:helix-turn-helix transcriptional regulator [Gracilibacillus timonensis]
MLYSMNYWNEKSNYFWDKYKDSYLYREQMILLLQKQISFDAYCCTVVNPTTLTTVGAITECSLESIHQDILAAEYDKEDVHLYQDLVESNVKSARLSDTFGKQKSRRFTDILSPRQISDELRVTLMDKGKCFGFLTLFKKEEKSYFTDQEVLLLEGLSLIMGKALRDYFYIELEKHSKSSYMGSGVIILDQYLTLQSTNEAGKQYITLLQEFERSKNLHRLPKSLQAICAKLSAQDEKSFSVFIPLADKIVLVASASFLRSGASHKTMIAITIDKASPKEMFGHLMETYALTAREKQVVTSCIQGASTKEIANQFKISYYTVQDHLKGIFYKVGVQTRNELVWKLFANHP